MIVFTLASISVRQLLHQTEQKTKNVASYRRRRLSANHKKNKKTDIEIHFLYALLFLHSAVRELLSVPHGARLPSKEK